MQKSNSNSRTKVATLAAGCFWGVENLFQQVEGVIETEVGYTGGNTKNPTYKEVCSHKTGHAEAVKIKFDPSVINYLDLLKIFFENHDPTTPNRQGPDVGSQYRSAIFYHSETQKQIAQEYIKKLENEKKFSNPIVTEIVPATHFYGAEEYHQNYFQKNGRSGCHFVF